MATQKPTQLGYGELGKLAAGEAATAVKSIVGLSGACTVAEASTFANPGGATKIAVQRLCLGQCHYGQEFKDDRGQ